MRAVLVLSLCVLVLSALAFSTSRAISLTDYKFPKSATQEAYLNGAFNMLGNSVDSTEVGYNFGGSASYRLALRSLPFSYDLSILGDFAVAKGTEKDSESEDAYHLNATTNADKYLRDDSNLFGFAGAMLDYRKLAGMDKADDPRVDLEAGVGYGRTINATVLKQAIRINEDFRKYGVVTRDIPDAVLLELAAIIDRRSEFRSEYGPVEFQKYWFEAMEELLTEAGVLADDNLGAIGVLRIQEVLAEPTAQRWHGWSVRAGIGARVSDYDGESGDPRLSARFHYTRPVGIDLQFSNLASFATVFEDDPVHNLQNIFRVDYEISNRIDWYNSLTLNYDIMTAEGMEDIFSASLRSTYIFYLENQLSFNPEFQYRYLDDGIGDAAWDWAILGSITYRLR